MPVHICVAEVGTLGPADRPLNSCRAGDGAHTCVVSSPPYRPAPGRSQVITQSHQGQKGVNVLAFMKFIWGLLKAPFIALKRCLVGGAETESSEDCSAEAEVLAEYSTDVEVLPGDSASDIEDWPDPPAPEEEVSAPAIETVRQPAKRRKRTVPRRRCTRPHGRQTRPGPRARGRR